MDQRMQEYWERKREGLVVEIQSLESKVQEKPVSDLEWKRLDSIARRQLRRLKRQAVATATRNAWKHWRQFGWNHTISTVWQLRRYMQSNLQPHLMCCVGTNASSECIYEFGLSGKDVQHQFWATGLDRDCLSNRKLFLSVDNLATKHNLFRVYPSTSTTPLSLDIGTDLGVRLKGRADISLDGLAPSAFMEHLQTVESLTEMCVNRAEQELVHWRTTYKLEHLSLLQNSQQRHRLWSRG